MITYQDFMKVGDAPTELAKFVRRVIDEHRGSELYQTAKTADEYDRCRNTTVMQYQKVITLVTGQVVPDKYSATHRSCSNYFNIFTTQLCQYLLGNGVTWHNDQTAKLGDDFDLRLQQIAKAALCGSVAYGFYTDNHVIVFTPLDFAALQDEETGEIPVGVRFWQIAPDKPLRAALYETDGVTNFMWAKDNPGDEWDHIADDIYMQPKTAYTYTVTGDNKDRADGTVEVVPGEPAQGFPIIPLYANRHHQSELVGLREKIDAYDFILNGFEDDLDNAQLYWILSGAGGMEDGDLQQFLDRLKTVKAAAPDTDQTVTPVTVEIPVTARETLLERLNKQLYRDAMIMNPEDIASGATTATQIKAAYERQNVKADQLEYCVLEFLYKLMEIAGIDDAPSFTRSVIVNSAEEVQTLTQAAQWLPDDYVRQKVLTLMGDGDKYEEIQKQMDADDMPNMNTDEDETE